MSEGPADDPGTEAAAFEVHGVRVGVRAPDPGLVPRVVEQFPVHASRCDPEVGDQRFALEVDSAGDYVLVENGTVRDRAPEINGALALLRRHLAFFAVDPAREHLVIAAGAVGHGGRAILLPGPTTSGKSTLVAALLRAGAAYYTDDWAVLDEDGRVHPSSRTLQVSDEGWVWPQSLGAIHGDEPIAVSLIARTSFKPGGRWQPRPRTTAAAVMMLLGHAYGIDDPPAAMKVAQSTVANATVIEGERGEADEAAAALLDVLARTPLPGSS